MEKKEQVHAYRQSELDRQKIRQEYKDRFTVLAIADGVQPCKRCSDPYCLQNIPHYERWDFLIQLVKKLSVLISVDYKGQVFEIDTLKLSADYDTVVNAAVSFINYHNEIQNNPCYCGKFV